MSAHSHMDDVDARVHTDRQTDTQYKYCKPRCACLPRLNKSHAIRVLHSLIARGKKIILSSYLYLKYDCVIFRTKNWICSLQLCCT